MSIPLLVTTGLSVEVAHTGDPCVDGKPGDPRWVLASDAVCKKGADLVAIRALNGEERWNAHRVDSGPGEFYFWCDTGVVSLNGGEGVRDWLRDLPATIVVQLATAVMALTNGMDIDQAPAEEDAPPEGETFPGADGG